MAIGHVQMEVNMEYYEEYSASSSPLSLMDGALL